MTRKRARLYMVFLLLSGASIAAFLVLTALSQNVSYFRTPSEVIAGTYPEKESGRNIRLGGLVEKNSLQHDGDEITFRITDMKNDIPVTYRGTIPDLFREGQGVIVTGKMNQSGLFHATILLAKHDEKYTPPEVAKELKNASDPP